MVLVKSFRRMWPFKPPSHHWGLKQMCSLEIESSAKCLSNRPPRSLCGTGRLYALRTSHFKAESPESPSRPYQSLRPTDSPFLRESTIHISSKRLQASSSQIAEQAPSVWIPPFTRTDLARPHSGSQYSSPPSPQTSLSTTTPEKEKTYSMLTLNRRL